MMDEFRLIEETIRQQQTRYWGKYRAFVVDAEDPERRGRVTLQIPSVLGEAVSGWALPAFAYGGGAGFGFAAIPPSGSQVLAEFVEGDLSSPVWTGTFHRPGEMPDGFTGQATKVLRTESGHSVVLDDTSGTERLSLCSAKGAAAMLDETGSLVLTDSSGATVALDTTAGEIVVEDANGNTLRLSAQGITATDASGNSIEMAAGGVTVSASASVTIKGSAVALGGMGGEPLVKGQSFMAVFNSHTHNCTAPGSPSGPPLSPLTPSAMTSTTTAS